MSSAEFVQDEPLPDLIESRTVEKLAGEFRFTEGPVWKPEGYLLFSDTGSA